MMMEEGRSGELKGKGRGAIALPSSGLTGCQIKEARLRARAAGFTLPRQANTTSRQVVAHVAREDSPCACSSSSLGM